MESKNKKNDLGEIILKFLHEAQESNVLQTKSFKYEKKLADELGMVCENIKNENTLKLFLELETSIEELKIKIKKDYFQLGFAAGKAEIELCEKQ